MQRTNNKKSSNKKISLPVGSAKHPTAKPLKEKAFTVVAIGASAGGLEAVTALLKNLTATTGMAFIYVQHLSPDHKSQLASILSRATKMKVQEIDDMEKIKPNNVYIIPYNKGIKVTDGHIKLIPRNQSNTSSRGTKNVSTIDILFSSLAQTHKANVIGIILSGHAKDGTIGLKAIKQAGGVTFAQDNSAQARSMPKSAIASGMVDFVLSPKKIASEINLLSVNKTMGQNIKLRLNQDSLNPESPDEKTIFSILHKAKGVDFSHYKMATVNRRMHHRMFQSNKQTIKEYVKLLIKDPGEVDLLYKDLLINVSDFFRDTEIFRYLKTTFLPKLLKSKTEGETLRIWIPACSLGQEAYSIAMLLTELQDNKTKKIPIKIFATDLSDQAVNNARKAEYSLSALKAISKNNIKRFFTKTGTNYRINKEIREMCTFAPHNILSDPPFFRIDFISCRNLLIYFDASAQKKVLATLHFSLSEGGFLMLGKSETTGTSSQLFTPLNNNFKIYSRKKNAGVHKLPDLASRFPGISNIEKIIKPVSRKIATVDNSELDSTIDSVLLSRYMPACAIINSNMEIIQFRGSTSIYLSHPSGGKASLNILKMTRPEFAFELRSAIHQVIKTKQPVRKSDIEMNRDIIGSTFQMMSLEVSPLKIEWDEPLLLVVFTLQENIKKQIENDRGKRNNSTEKDKRIKKLIEELSSARAEMDSVIESQESSYEELQSANEEIVSTNEEFQTLNEELETSKEEIEATNEELISTNQELKTQNELLAESYHYSEAIIATIHEPMIILDSHLCVKSANRSFYKKFLISKQETEGKSLFKLGNKQWAIPKLHKLLDDLLSKNVHFQGLEVIHTFPKIGEKTMLLNAHRIIQKTHDEKLILFAIEDITERSILQRKINERNEQDIIRHLANKVELEKLIKHRTKQLEQKNIELEKANKQLAFQNKEKEKRSTELGIANKELAFQNKEKEKHSLELSIANKDLTTFTYVSSHDLQEPLRKIQNFAALILAEEGKKLSETGKGYFSRIQQTANRMQTLIEDLLTYSRAKPGKHNFENTNLNLILDEVIKEFEEAIREKKAIIEAMPLGNAGVIPFQFRQLFHNLISNSLKFTHSGKAPHIKIKSKLILGSKSVNKNLLPGKKYLNIVFTDKGIGFDPQYQERIFEVFQRLHNFEVYKGTGIGLAICKRIVENHHGFIAATSKLNEGARFDIYIPA